MSRLKGLGKGEGFLADLVEDLKNRRLIPAILLLVAAIVLVPLLVGSQEAEVEPASTPTATSAALDPALATETTPAVLTNVPGLRDYRERLDAFKRKNPFKQQLTEPPARVQRQLQQEQQGAQGGAGGSGPASTLDFPGPGGPPGGGDLSDLPGIGGGSTSPDDGGSSSTIGGSGTGGSGGTPGGSGGDGSDADSGGGSGDDGSGGSEEAGAGGDAGSSEDPQVVKLTYKIDVEIGPTDNVREKRNVEPLEFLPNADTRVFNFLQPNFMATEATFSVNPETTRQEGEGECKPSPESCALLTLEEGQEHRLTYEPNGKRYLLRLLDIKVKQELVPLSEIEGLGSE